MTKEQNINYLTSLNIITLPLNEEKTEKELKKYFNEINSINLNELTKQQTLMLIKTIDYILTLSATEYYAGTPIISNTLYDNEGTKSNLIWKGLQNNNPLNEKSFYYLFTKLAYSYNHTFFNEETDIENLNDEDRRIFDILDNPTATLTHEEDVVNNKTNKKRKTLPSTISNWLEKNPQINKEAMENLLNSFQEKVPVVGEEGSTIVKATDRETINESIKEIGKNADFGPKLDGLSGYVHLKKQGTKYVFSGLYGRGGKTSLTNISYKAAMIPSIPKSIKNNKEIFDDNTNEIEIRGEIIIKKIGSTENTLDLINNDMIALNIVRDPYTNLRNAAAGMIKNEDLPPEILEKYIDFVPFHIYQINTNTKTANKINNQTANIIYKENKLNVIPNFQLDTQEKGEAFYELMDCISNGLESEHLEPILGKEIYETTIKFPYECDGVIVTDSTSNGKVNGSNELEGVVALKFSAPTERTKIIDIEVAMNKSNISFVVKIEPTRIGGVTVNNISGAVKEAKDIDTLLEIYQVGQEIEIARSGGVIPNLLSPTDEYSFTIYNYIKENAITIFEKLENEKLISKNELIELEKIIKLGLGEQYNSTSKTYWMDIKIGCIYNSLVNNKDNDLNEALLKTIMYAIKKIDLKNTNIINNFVEKAITNQPKTNITNENKNLTHKIKTPTNCPSCGEQLLKSETGKQLSCINDECLTRRISKLTSFLNDLQKNGNKTNIDDRKMEAILKYFQIHLYNEKEPQNTINDYTKLYEFSNNPNALKEIIEYSNLTAKTEENPLSFQETRAEKFINDIKLTKGAKESDFIGSLNIESFKSSMARKLLKVIPLKELIENDYSETNKSILKEKIINIPDFAEKTANVIITFFEKYKNELKKLIELNQPIKEVFHNIAADKSIQMTGTGSITWDFFKEINEEQISLTKGIPYSNIASTDSGGNTEIKEALKKETLFFTSPNDGSVTKLIGGNNPTGKTDIVMSDKIKDAISKAKALKNTIVLNEYNKENYSLFENLLNNNFKNENGEKKCIIIDTNFFVSFLKEYKLEEWQEQPFNEDTMKKIEEVLNNNDIKASSIPPKIRLH
jgi:NAD-dependent DNA ligase